LVDLDVSQNVHRLIAAPTGAGKSYFLGWLIEKLYAEKKIMGLIRRLLCRLGFHRWVWGPAGLTCEVCGDFVSRAEVLADLEAGGGWWSW